MSSRKQHTDTRAEGESPAQRHDKQAKIARIADDGCRCRR